MAQPISPMIWNKAAIEDNRLLPARYSIGIFTGKGVKIANNEDAYAYDDILVSDRIFDYDDRRLNGLVGTNSEGRDGWGASAYGPFQTVRFTRRVFTSGQHKSIAWRIFDEKQYTGEIGEWGTAAKSNAYTGGEAYMSTAETINKAKKIWDAEILGPHIDKYNFFAIANGHISGRFVQTHAEEGAMFDCDGEWIASPGPYEGVSYQPEFAPIKAIEWDSLNVRPMLNAIDVAWTNLYIPEDNRVILLDKTYKDELLSNLIGIPGSVPATDKAYDALVDGRFERFYGWDFDFSIPSQYYPKVYLDANNNVVHTPDGEAAYDKVMNSIDAPDGVIKLQNELVASSRTRATNYIGTYFDKKTCKFKNVITNYPMSMPSSVPYYGTPETVNEDDVDWKPKDLASFPWMGYPGQGIANPTGPVKPITRRQVIGMAVYRPAAQLGEEYGYMETDRGKTRGKFTELVFDVKHDAWVIPQYSHGILLIVDSQENVGTPTIKVEQVTQPAATPAKVTGVTAAPSTVEVGVDGTAAFIVKVAGEGAFDKTWTVTHDDTPTDEVSNDPVVAVTDDGLVRGLQPGSSTITIKTNGKDGALDPQPKTTTVTVTVK